MVAVERLICASADLLESGRGVRFEIDRDGRKDSAFAIRYHGRAYAYMNRCAHVPVELDWTHGEFFDADGLYLICATHGALYDPATGDCLVGRCAGRGLEPVALVERDENVFLSLEGD